MMFLYSPLESDWIIILKNSSFSLKEVICNLLFISMVLHNILFKKLCTDIMTIFDT